MFSKLDVWPVLAERAARRGVRLGLISATLVANSARSSVVGAMLLRDAYRALDAVGAISPDDALRLQALGVRGDRMTVTGDARYDEAWARAQDAEPRRMLIEPLHSDRPTLVAGSTWPADEAPLLNAWRLVRERVPSARLVIAPHEPAPSELEAIARWAAQSGVRCATLGTPAAATADLVLVNRVGVLGDLYALAGVAYVGGGFHAAGLHSVIEPAAFGVPGAVRAAALREPRRGAPARVRRRIQRGVCDRARRAIARAVPGFGSSRGSGYHARALVQSGLGAADRSVELVEKLLAT